MSTIKTTTLSNVAGTSSVPVDTVINGSAKAWVNFNGTGTVAIRASFNVSSITDNGTGDYTVNFTTAMTDANYAVAGAARYDGNSNAVTMRVVSISSGGASLASDMSTTSLRISVCYSNGNVEDPLVATAIIFR